MSKQASSNSWMPPARVAFFIDLGLGLTIWLVLASSARSQTNPDQPLELRAISRTGLQPYLTESWGTLEFTLANPSAIDRLARLVVFYPEQPDLQYGREVWIPARSVLSTWMQIGPAPRQRATGNTRDLRLLLYDRTEGRERLLLPPDEKRFRADLGSYRPQEALTCLILDSTDTKDTDPASHPSSLEAPDPALQLVRTFRAVCKLSKDVKIVRDPVLPPMAEEFDGVAHVVLAGRRLAGDPSGQMALRRWLEQGGKLWIMLDRTDPDIISRLLGDAGDIQVLNRTNLTSVFIERPALEPGDKEPSLQELDQPVDFLRVAVGSSYVVQHRIGGWPASLTRQVGRGKLLITTLGARGWYRPRTAAELKSPFVEFPDLPALLPAMDLLTKDLQPPPESKPFSTAEFEPLVNAEVGYSLVGVSTASLIFGTFLIVVLVGGMVLRKSRYPEFSGWMAPALALVTAIVFIVLGDTSRRGVPTTMAVTQFIQVLPGTNEQPVTGLAGFYQPTAGPVALRSSHGGLMELDMTGLEGQNRRLVWTDLDAWHYENLALPPGLRLATFRYASGTELPIDAIAQFAPDGFKGKVKGGLHNLTDVLIHSPTGRTYTVHLQANGSFTVRDGDILPPGEFMDPSILTDSQQRRQAIFRRLLQETRSGNPEQRGIVLAWCDPMKLPFTFVDQLHTTGSALLSVPLKFETPPPNTSVAVLRGFIPYRRILPSGVSRPTLEGQQGIEMHLRFQLPPSVVPLKIDRARLFAKVSVPFRHFVVRANAGKNPIEILSSYNPTDPFRLDIIRDDLLQLDDQGGLHLDIAITDAPEGGDEMPPRWTIETLELEVSGRTPSEDSIGSR